MNNSMNYCIQPVHNNINSVNDKLNSFINNKNVPNILFHGNNISSINNIIQSFIQKLYNNNSDVCKKHIMIVNCAHGKGIRFVRDEIKFFAKTNISIENGVFKSIFLFNAEKLTIDAQSALRRCIEIFSHSTRFFLIVENKEKLLKPIISRLCDIFVFNYENINSHMSLTKSKMFNNTMKYLKNEINKFSNLKENLFSLSEKLYNKGVSSHHILHFIFTKNQKYIANDKYNILFNIHKIKNCVKDEKILITIILDLYFFRSDNNLENIDFL